jgi:hypothetical protein
MVDDRKELKRGDRASALRKMREALAQIKLNDDDFTDD